LDRAELSELWAAAQAGGSASSASAADADAGAGAGAGGAAAAPQEALPEATYRAACAKAGVEPKEGLDAEALGSLYDAGLADLDAHFAVLRDLLAQKLRKRGQAAREAQLADIAEGAGEDGASESEDDEDGGEDGEEESDSDADSAEVLECEDEDEFEEVMRVLGLRPATLDDNGDLRLPNGAVAAHRDVAHIWRQRGVRTGGQLAVRGGARPGPRRMNLMLSNSPAGADKVAMSQRAHAREGKRIIAVLRAKNHEYMKVGMNNNRLQTKTRKIRTGFGDASGGR